MLVHGTPYSSAVWRAIVPALSAHRRVYVFEHLGYGQSDQREGQDLGIAAQGRRFAGLLAEDAPARLVAEILAPPQVARPIP